MAAIWQVRLLDQSGGLVAILDDLEGFSFTRRVNTPGAYALRMDGNNQKHTLFGLDGRVEFWWRDQANDIPWRLEFRALHRSGRYYVVDDDRLKFESGGRGPVDLLNRRVVANKAGSAETSKAGPAETVTKAFVQEQCVDGRALANFAVEADAASGNTVTLARAYRNVLETVQEIARIGGGDFDVVSTGAASWEFRWYDGQLGTDRSATVVFALERGNMARPELVMDRANEVTAVLVGGGGQEDARETIWRTDPVRIADSPWNRIEAFADGRNDTTDGLITRGDARLEEGRPKNLLQFEVMQVPGCLYGLHYFLGDLVTARFLGYETIKKVLQVTVTVDQNGEKRTLEMADV